MLCSQYKKKLGQLKKTYHKQWKHTPKIFIILKSFSSSCKGWLAQVWLNYLLYPAAQYFDNSWHFANCFPMANLKIVSFNYFSQDNKYKLIFNLKQEHTNQIWSLNQLFSINTYLIFVLSSPQTKYVIQFFPTQKCVNRNRTYFATKTA